MIAMSYKRMSFLVMAALLAAGPSLAQVRIGSVAEAGVPGATGASVTGSFSGISGPLLAPSLSAAILNTSFAAPIAPALQPAGFSAPALVPVQAAAARPVLPKSEGVQAALQALAPDNLNKISGENAKALSGRLLGLEEERADASGTDDVPGLFAASIPDLEPASDGVQPARDPRVPGPEHSKAGPTAADKFHHARLLTQNYYWYSVTHIINMWPSYKKRWDEARVQGAANVSRPRAFFAYMRIAAISGRFYVLGAAPLEDDAVIAEFRKTLVKWYDAPGAIGTKELAAFDAFSARAKAYNSERRAPSNMRKHLRDALIKGSTMEPAKLAQFFDSLLVEETARETADFQNKGAQKRILDTFTRVLHDTLAEEPMGVNGRVRAAILLGSFATGSAGPKSDFDVELLTDGGSNIRSVAFIKRLTERWISTGHHARNPVTVHDFPSTPTRGIIDLVHTGDFMLVSLEENLVRDLQRLPGEYSPRMIRSDSLRGRINRAIQYGVIILSTYVGDVKARFGAASSHH